MKKKFAGDLPTDTEEYIYQTGCFGGDAGPGDAPGGNDDDDDDDEGVTGKDSNGSSTNADVGEGNNNHGNPDGEDSDEPDTSEDSDADGNDSNGNKNGMSIGEIAASISQAQQSTPMSMFEEFERRGLLSTLFNHIPGLLIPGVDVQANFSENPELANTTSFGVAEAIGDIAGLAIGVPGLGTLGSLVDTAETTSTTSTATPGTTPASSAPSASVGPTGPSNNDGGDVVQDRSAGDTPLTNKTIADFMAPAIQASAGLLNGNDLDYLSNQGDRLKPAARFSPEYYGKS